MTQAALEVYSETITPLQGGDPVSFRMIKVEGGEFWMGSEESDKDAWDREKPVHRVKLSTFWIGEFQVTQALWVAVMGDNPAYFPGMDRPVESVSWLDISERFLPTLNQRGKQNYRLPTEAEWEYAARGASTLLNNPNPSFKYAGSNRLEDLGWYYENSHRETKTVGLKRPNVLGLYDMSGNVWEWCSDWYDEKYYGTCAKTGVVENPIGYAQGRFRVLRGGSWYLNGPGLCRVSYRFTDAPEDASYDRGFRLVVSSWQ